jgi:hypothetical protein
MKKAFAMIVMMVSMTMAQIPSNGLVAWYPFNGNSVDEAGNTDLLPTTTAPTLTPDRFSVADRAYSFNGTNSALTAIDSALPMGSSDRTISMWYIATAGGSGTNKITALSYGQIDTAKILWIYFSYFNSTPYITISNLKDSVTARVMTNTTGFNHFCITYSADSVSVYFNGVLAKKGYLKLRTEPGRLGVGALCRFATLGTNTLGGKLDDVALYNKTLTAAQVQILYNSKSYVNNAPKITSNPALGASVGIPYSYTFTVVDTNIGQTISSTLIEKPTGMTLIGNKLSWIPAVQGPQKVTIKTSDNLGDTSAQSFTIIVQPPTDILNKNYVLVSVLARNQQPCYSIAGRALNGKYEGVRIYKSFKKIDIR